MDDMGAAGDIEIFRHRLGSIVEEMGATLQRTAYSTNIKIRRDHTCALFDAELRHIAQHDIAPQHIGTLISLVPSAIQRLSIDLEPGDGVLINDPYQGTGALHLPDVVLICPLFADGDLVAYAANSAHHVDIGGSSGGGIPPTSTELYQEGLILPGIRAVRNWEYEDNVLTLVTRNVRGTDQRRGDYEAQLGANRIGQERYRSLVEEHGRETVEDSLDGLLDYTERRLRAAIADLPDGEYHAEDTMDGDGIVEEPLPLSLTVEVDGTDITFDFTGTAEENAGPLNCTPALAFAGALYSIMALLGTEFPKNDGFYRPFETITPKGTMVNPSKDSPVAGGAEIAVRIADLVLAALADALPEETVAGGKGTIVNLSYSGEDPRTDEDYVYYETVAGGYGARATKDGMEAVQAHYQNTANSPIEELEAEIPLYVRRYELIPDSAGAGRTRGGLGVRRDMEFYAHEASFTVLADRATAPPKGLFGGRNAITARYCVNPDGDDPVDLGSKRQVTLDPGDVASVQTPGGGGYGDPLERAPVAVRDDVVNGKLSVDYAREVYGVVVDPETGEIDDQATAERRAELAAEPEGAV
jgi:N-methylhydantoinase B